MDPAGRRMHMICPNCGKEILDSAAFCTQCGANIAKMTAAAVHAAAEPVSESNEIPGEDGFLQETDPTGGETVQSAGSQAPGSGKTPDSYDPHMYDDTRPHGQHLHANESQAKLEQGYQEQGYTGQEQTASSPQYGDAAGKKTFLSVRTASLLCYWFSLIGWAVSYFLSDKNDPYLRFHLNQSLVLALAALVIDFLGRIDSLGTVVFALGIARFVLWVIAFVRSCKGSTDPVPLIGDIHIIN